MAEKVTVVPTQAGLVPEIMAADTEGTSVALILMVTVFELTVELVTQFSFEVRMQVTMSLFASPDEV